jgi:fumarylpyruvate hydrolase
MNYAIEPAPPAVVPVKGSDKVFPIHRIYCVGRNYHEHTKEMGGDTRDPPFFFQKNADNIVTNGTFPYPRAPATSTLRWKWSWR